MKGLPKPLGESRGKKTEIDGETHGERHTGITIFDKSEPRSVYNLVTDELQASIDRVHPTVWEYSFANVEKHARADSTLAQLRVAFWHEYNEVQDKFKKEISITKVCHGICTRHKFYQYLKNQFHVAYLLYPTTDYISAMLEMHDLATREMRKILKMPNAGKKGANMPVIREKIKIFALLENRLRGSVPVRVERDSRHVHVHTTPEIHQNHQEAPKSLKEIQKEINRIERTVKNQIEKEPLVIDAEAQSLTTSEEPHGGGNS